MSQIISGLSGRAHFTVGFMDSRLGHFGAYSKGMLPAHAAADIAGAVVERHQADQDVFAALTDFVKDVQHQAGSGPDSAAPDATSHVLRNALITLGVIGLVIALGFFLIARPVRERRRREFREARSAAQDDLIALSDSLTSHHADVSIQSKPEAASILGTACR